MEETSQAQWQVLCLRRQSLHDGEPGMEKEREGTTARSTHSADATATELFLDEQRGQREQRIAGSASEGRRARQE